MKHKTVLMLCLLAGIRSASFAQFNPYYQPPVRPANNTEALFNYPAPGSLKNNFTFLLRNGDKVMLELSSINQLSEIPQVDSLIKKVWTDLQIFGDSLNKPLVSRRVDYVVTNSDKKIRILEYTQKGQAYSVRNNEVVQLKVEQDTLRIKLYTLKKAAAKGNIKKNTIFEPYFITFYLNNISDITSIAPDELSKGLALLKRDLENSKNARKGKENYNQYYALYNLQNETRISPVNNRNFGFGRNKKTSVIPYIPVGVQYVRGAWAPSVGAGLELSMGNPLSTRMLRLYWEPLFFFRRDGNGKLATERNDFISFKFTNNAKDPVSKNLTYALNFSAGYLIRRRGDWLEKNTVKFSLPGMQMKNVLLEPEFFFNNFFKNFNPSLKLSLYFE